MPDLPVEEAEDLSKLAADRDFKLILLVTPTTSPERAEKVVKACGGFVYVVSVVGITGAARPTAGRACANFSTRLRTMTDLPLCVGFGVSKPDHVRELKEIADGVIVGSALVKQLEARGRRSRRDAGRREATRPGAERGAQGLMSRLECRFQRRSPTRADLLATDIALQIRRYRMVCGSTRSRLAVVRRLSRRHPSAGL